MPPVISGSVVYGAGGGGWGRTSAMLHLVASDPAGYAVTIAGDIGGVAFSCGTSCDLDLPEGEGTAHYTAVSASGRTASGASTWRLDLHPPTLAPSLTGGAAGDEGWYRAGPVTLTCAGADSLSGWGGAVYGARTAEGDGDWTLSCTGNDLAGNETGPYSVVVRIDSRPPAVSISPSWFIGSSGAVSGSDSGSGIATSNVIVSREGMAPWVRAFIGLPAALTWDGTDGNGAFGGYGDFHVTLRVRDVAGNEAAVDAVIRNPQPVISTPTLRWPTRTASPTMTLTATLDAEEATGTRRPVIRATATRAGAIGVVIVPPEPPSPQGLTKVVFPAYLLLLSILIVAWFFLLRLAGSLPAPRRKMLARVEQTLQARRIAGTDPATTLRED